MVDFLEYVRASYGLPEAPAVVARDVCWYPLSQLGWSVTGYEPDSDYAPAAREALRDVPEAEFRQGGFGDLEERAAFDLIAAVNGPYYYLLEPTARREALQRCARALRPGSVLLLDLSNFLWILKNYREPPSMRLSFDGTEVTRFAKHEFDYHLGIMTHEDRFVWTGTSGEEHTAHKTHRMALVTFSEIAFFLDDLGFGEMRTFNSYTDLESARLTGKKLMITARWGHCVDLGFLTNNSSGRAYSAPLNPIVSRLIRHRGPPLDKESG